MMNPNDIQKISLEQRDFWDSLQLDILASNQGVTAELFQAFIERNLIFSLISRGASVIEMSALQRLFHSKDYGYLVLFELAEPKKTGLGNFIIDEFELHYFIKEHLPDYDCFLSPFLNNRIAVLVSLDASMSEDLHREHGLSLCHGLIPLTEAHFHVKVTAGIGSIYHLPSVHSSYASALACLPYSNFDPVIFYADLKNYDPNLQFDYLVTQKRLMEALQLRKTRAYNYFSILIDYIRPMNDVMKRNKILELLVLVNNAMDTDNQEGARSFDYMDISRKLMDFSGEQLIDYAYQTFVFLSSYTRPQNSIDYSNHIVKATREYLESHYADDISLEAMAEHVNISPQYFSKLIKKTTGFNFIDWLSMLRVKKAKELLTNSSLTVKEVCFMVGYKDPNYFSRIFKKRIGLTPSEYVKANSFLNNKN
ncbi:MAG TPA: helix-turn-helix transcriptional regulator [Clostridiales bacterium]|nr:helix-turn-helix transcriptional regulator [Clostridiales bacterium]